MLIPYYNDRFFVAGSFTRAPDNAELVIKAQILELLWFKCSVEKPCYRKKTPLAIGGT